MAFPSIRAARFCSCTPRATAWSIPLACFLLVLQHAAAQGCGYSRVPFPNSPVIPGFQFPESEATINNWVSTGDSASIDLHGWGIWTRINQDTGQTFNGQTLRAWETWQSPSMIIAGCQWGPWPLETPNQTSDPGMLVTVRYSPEAADHASQRMLFDVPTLNNMISQQQAQIPVFPNTSITLKPVIVPNTINPGTLDIIQPSRPNLYRLPVWDGPPNPAAVHGPAQWRRWVWVDLLDFGNGSGNGSVDLTGNTPTPQNTYGLGRFIHFRTPDGVRRLCVAMHMTTRETTRWTWSTFWWTPTPDSPRMPSSSTTASRRPSELTGAPRHYAMCTAYQMVTPVQPNTGGTNTGVSAVFCYNPWLEAGFGPSTFTGVPNQLNSGYQYGVQTNCMSCHAMARYPDTSPSYTTAQYIDIGSRLLNKLRLDLAWSVEGNAGSRGVQAVQTTRLGTPPNPNALTAPTGPILGSVWNVSVGPIQPIPVFNALVLGFSGPANFPLGTMGTLLCDLQSHVIVFSPPGMPFPVPIPSDCCYIGFGVCTQGLQVDATFDVKFTNALDVYFGTY